MSYPRFVPGAAVLAALLFAAQVFAACAERGPEPNGTSDIEAANEACDVAAARGVVEQFGDRLKQVSLLGPDSLAAREMHEAYGDLVDPQLLEAWMENPAIAPGRTTSSPWPERIEIARIDSIAPSTCRVEGVVVYETSTGVERGGAAVRDSVTVRVERRDGWRIQGYRSSANRSVGTSDATAVVTAVIRAYYDALNAGDYRRAYEMWGGAGEATGQSLEEYAAFFENTEYIDLEIGRPGRIEPAAGSRYVEVPVMLRAEGVGGNVQRFEGTYTLRQSVVDGATPAQRHWHLYSADVEPSE